MHTREPSAETPSNASQILALFYLSPPYISSLTHMQNTRAVSAGLGGVVARRKSPVIDPAATALWSGVADLVHDSPVCVA